MFPNTHCCVYFVWNKTTTNGGLKLGADRNRIRSVCREYVRRNDRPVCRRRLQRNRSGVVGYESAGSRIRANDGLSVDPLPSWLLRAQLWNFYARACVCGHPVHHHLVRENAFVVVGNFNHVLGATERKIICVDLYSSIKCPSPTSDWLFCFAAHAPDCTRVYRRLYFFISVLFSARFLSAHSPTIVSAILRPLYRRQPLPSAMYEIRRSFIVWSWVVSTLLGLIFMEQNWDR